jgi:thioesterase domain-containing protein
MFGKHLPATLCILAFMSSASATVVYKWVDENGVTHFSQEPPPKGQADMLDSADIEQAKTGFVAPKVSQKEDPQDSDIEKAAELIKQKDAKQAKSICDNAKHSLDILTTYTKLSRQDDKGGEPVAMTEEERQAAIKEQQEKIKLFCSK